jgi:hypothetical protein
MPTLLIVRVTASSPHVTGQSVLLAMLFLLIEMISPATGVGRNAPRIKKGTEQSPVHRNIVTVYRSI